MVERLIKAIRERQNLRFTPMPFKKDNKKDTYLFENEINYYFAKVNPYPTFNKIMNNILKETKDKNIYTNNIHKELKTCYENHWNMKIDVGYMETLSFNFPITDWKKKNINEELMKIINKIMDYIDKSKNINEVKKLANETTDEKRIMKNNMTIYFKTDFEIDKKPSVNKRRKSYFDDYLNSTADFE